MKRCAIMNVIADIMTAAAAAGVTVDVSAAIATDIDTIITIAMQNEATTMKVCDIVTNGDIACIVDSVAVARLPFLLVILCLVSSPLRTKEADIAVAESKLPLNWKTSAD